MINKFLNNQNINKVDIAVASDRENDTLAIFSISENAQLNKLSTPQLDDAEF